MEQEQMPSANVAPLLEVGFEGYQCLIAEQWAQDYAKTYTRTKLERLAIRVEQRGWEEEAEVMRAAASDTDQALTLLAMLHGRVCHMMAHLGMVGEVDTRHTTVEKLGDALDDVTAFVARVLKPAVRPDYVSAPVTECECCMTPDACAIRGQCAHYLRERPNVVLRGAHDDAGEAS